MFRIIFILFMLILANNSFSQGMHYDFDTVGDFYKNSSTKIFKNKLDIHWAEDESYLWYKVNSSKSSHDFFVVNLKSGKKYKAFEPVKLADAIHKFSNKKVNSQNLSISFMEFSDDFKEFSFIINGEALTCQVPTYKISKSIRKEKEPEELRKSEKSFGGGNKVNFTLKNSSKEMLKINWIDFDGRKKSFGELKDGESRTIGSFAKHTWLIENRQNKAIKIVRLANGNATLEIKDTKPLKLDNVLPRFKSPDGQWSASIKEHNIFLTSLSNNQTKQLSFDGDSKDIYTRSFYWSPDSTKLICIKEKTVPVRQISMVESSPKDQVQPKVHTINYVKPGDPLPFKRPKLFDARTFKEIPVDEKLFVNPFSNSRYRWNENSKTFTFLHNQRGHQVLRLISINAENGHAQTLIDETSKTFVHYSGKLFLKHLDKTNEIIWMSERSGWNHLYLIDAESNKTKNPITSGEWLVRKVIDVDVEKRQITFEAGCLYPDQDPYHVHICRVNFDGSEFIKLTSSDGTHSYELSPKGNFAIATWSKVDQPPVVEIRSVKNGQLVCELERADCSELLKSAWRTPIRFSAKGRDNKTDIWGIITLPRNFDPSKKYPVLEQIYAGPHSSHVPKSFSTLTRQHKLADRGFIVVQIDGMGTSNRSKKFHDVCWQNLGDGGFPDRILWMKAAAKTIPQMDLSRVGIYGGSAGGQNALRALLAFGDFYKAAAADCGCHDNRMDKIWWNEQWMGWPIGKHYEEQSNVSQAHKLEGKLLLTVGELDKNVDPASTMQVADALIKAGKDFDLIVFPGKGHGIGWSPYGMKKLHEFFINAFYK
ncbi:MAG: prolyl oligopeptidase family serine peptidase [Lentisphaeraceae bacterium]|nr:prolyl oligopeptidase family serine peptidase [Lentisphaeraceae bacterium]